MLGRMVAVVVAGMRDELCLVEWWLWLWLGCGLGTALRLWLAGILEAVLGSYMAAAVETLAVLQ